MIPNTRMRKELEEYMGGGPVISFIPAPELLKHSCGECVHFSKKGYCNDEGLKGEAVEVHELMHSCKHFVACPGRKKPKLYLYPNCECCACADWINGWLCCHAYGMTPTRHAVRRAHHCPEFSHIGKYAELIARHYNEE